MKLLLLLPTLLLISCGKREVVQVISGESGKNGESCYAESVPSGVNIICGDSVEFLPKGEDGKDGTAGIDGVNGTDGVDGKDGKDGTFLGYIEIIEVCPQISGDYKETLLLLDGVYMAYLTSNNWKAQRLSILPENILFETSDGRNVRFKIENGEILCQ